ncbi:hypothetical protein SAMN04488239_12615 [Ruegeria marina]|uniref:Transposase, IS6 family n=1 Tax=Ruegeria marina TaxID=639004 RepID=A0A1G7ELW9_9RHOB|nr:hypothetical protein SAMN04488239_12615 [Ruegeria marina]
MSRRKNPFKRHRFPREIILMAVRWYCRYPLSCRDVRDMLAERGGRSTLQRSIVGFASSAPKYASAPMGRIVPGEGFSGTSMRLTSELADGGVICGALLISLASLLISG